MKTFIVDAFATYIQVLLLCMHEKFTVSFESFQHIHMYTAAQWESMYYNVK